MRIEPELVELVATVASESSVDRAMDRLAEQAIAVTKSRHAMIARLNMERGILEFRHGAGPEWSGKGANLQIELDLSEGIVAHAAATGSTIVSGNVQEDPRYRNLFGTTRSEIAVPIRDLSGRVRAVFNLESDVLDAFDEDAIQVCEVLGALVAILVERGDAARREEALVEVGSALDQSHTESELLETVIQVASNVLRFQASSVFVLEPGSDRYVLRATMGRLKDQIGKIAYRAGEGCTGWVCGEGKPILLERPQEDPRWRGRFLEFPSEEIAGFLAVPILIRGKCHGAIRVIRRVTPNVHLDTRFTANDRRVLLAIAEQLGSGLEAIRAVERLVRSERMIAWGELSARSSHMIGNRVFAIKGDVNELRHLLSQRELDREQLQNLQQSLDTNLIRIEEILQDFRDFLAATQITMEPGDLAGLVGEAVREVFPKAGKVKLDLQLGSVPPVSFDAKRLRRALSELIENSLGFTAEGRLTVSTGLATAEQLQAAGLAVNKEYVAVEVADTGPGVEIDLKEKIFQPFFSSRVKGMGLGLSIVKGIVEAHGGRILETGILGKGAVFLMLFPVAGRRNTEKS